ncbi:MAG: NTP transferase domain-containing protein [Euryarchaeota archaeon]|nr:NTP transferase domain-containing protein [Euryarchaeota archaeon]
MSISSTDVKGDHGMHAVVMAGGVGSRFFTGRWSGEKPMVELCKRPLITYVIDTLKRSRSIDRIFVVTSPSVPQTRKYVEKQEDIFVIPAPGLGYVGDMVHGIHAAGINDPVLVIMSDLPLIRPEMIDGIVLIYEERDEPALSVHTPLSVCTKLGQRPTTVFNRNGELIVPCGINILDGSLIDEEQPDFNLILSDLEVVLNVNTVEDLKRCELMLLERGG